LHTAAAISGLTERGHEGRTYDLTGPEALTHSEMATDLSDARGRRVEFVDVSPNAMRGALIGFGLPAWQIDGLLEDYAHYRRGEASAVATGVQDVTGQAPRRFAEFARDYAAAFS
jgi:uncharacterized protein YbjT (DUF2867 family)